MYTDLRVTPKFFNDLFYVNVMPQKLFLVKTAPILDAILDSEKCIQI